MCATILAPQNTTSLLYAFNTFYFKLLKRVRDPRLFERNQSIGALAQIIEGGFFLRKKSIEFVCSLSTSTLVSLWAAAVPGNLKVPHMPEPSPADRYYKWTRTCFIFVAVLMVIILTKFLTFGPRNYWPLVPLLPLPFLFLLNLWLAFRRVHRALPDDPGFHEHSGHSIVEGLFGLALTGACGLLIALIVGFMIGKLLAH